MIWLRVDKFASFSTHRRNEQNLHQKSFFKEIYFDICVPEDWILCLDLDHCCRPKSINLSNPKLICVLDKEYIKYKEWFFRHQSWWQWANAIKKKTRPIAPSRLRSEWQALKLTDFQTDKISKMTFKLTNFHAEIF